MLVQRSVSPFLHEFRADLIDESGALCRGADTGRVQDDATGTPMQRYRGCGVLCLVVAFVFFGRGGSKWGVEFEKGKAERGAGGGRHHFLKGLCGVPGLSGFIGVLKYRGHRVRSSRVSRVSRFGAQRDYSSITKKEQRNKGRTR